MSKLYITFRFGQAPVYLLNDKNISLKAKGLFTFIQSKPEGWSFSAKRISAQTKDGIDSVSGGLRELEEHGFLVRVASKDKNGRVSGFDYYLFHEKQTKNDLEKPYTENPVMENPTHYSKKDYSKKEVVTNCARKEKESVISLFDMFWTAFNDKRGKKPALKAFKKAIKNNNADEIIEGAKKYSSERENLLAKNSTPKMAQGWLTDERWNDEIKQLTQSKSPSGTCDLCVSLSKCPGKTTRSPACERYEGGVSL